MKKLNLIFSLILFSFTVLFSQTAETGLRGRIVDENNDPVSFATISLFSKSDSSLVKAGYSLEDGSFLMIHLNPGNYTLNISFVGYDTHVIESVEIEANNTTQLNQISLSPFATELGEVVVTTTRPLVEVKPDKTVFNVEGSTNAIGNDALELLRKAP